MIKNSSTRPPQNDNLGPVSESVHEMDDLSQIFGPLSTWTGGRMDGPQRAVFVQGGLVGIILPVASFLSITSPVKSAKNCENGKRTNEKHGNCKFEK